MMKCPFCGSELENFEMFCPFCKNEIGAENSVQYRRRKDETTRIARPQPLKIDPLFDIKDSAEQKNLVSPMVKKHQHHSIVPNENDISNVHWIRYCVIFAISICIFFGGGYYYLKKTDSGQHFLASQFLEADAQSYYTLGCELMKNGSIVRAVDALEIAQYKEPEKLEYLFQLGKAYRGIGRYIDAERVFLSVINKWPVYPEAYTQLISLLQEQGRKYDAYQICALAIQKTDDSIFTTLQTQMLPARPSVSIIGGTFKQPFDLTINTSDSGIIYYTLLGQDPLEEGTVYSGPIHLEEGTWKVRAVLIEDGLSSLEQTQVYIVNKPSPDMPKPTLATDTYSSVRTVGLRAGSDVIAMYYTMDGTTPTVESRLYEGPIKLRVGKTVLKAIAVNADGKTSNVMEVEYVCEGKVKKSMLETDTISDLSLYGTTKKEFIKRYGDPIQTVDDGSDDLGYYVRAYYQFGSAVFLEPLNGSEPKLVELYINSGNWSCPRGTRIGSSMSDVLDAYRDEGGEANVKGNRVLYTLSSGNIGMLSKTGDTTYEISYYCKLNSGAYIELNYLVESEVVTAIEWIWFVPES